MVIPLGQGDMEKRETLWVRYAGGLKQCQSERHREVTETEPDRLAETVRVRWSETMWIRETQTHTQTAT
jgi:hypothetical protein